MTDEESTQRLVGDDTAEPQDAASTAHTKFTLLDIYHIVQELNFLRGGGGWTGTLAESISRSLLRATCGFPAARARQRLRPMVVFPVCLL